MNTKAKIPDDFSTDPGTEQNLTPVELKKPTYPGSCESQYYNLKLNDS
jgi:hypothetical protein